MKILWMCNTILPIAARELGEPVLNKEGWLEGLCGAILDRQEENGIELHVAFPTKRELSGMSGTVAIEPELISGKLINSHKLHTLVYHTFYEDTVHPERYGRDLEEQIGHIINDVQPDILHCFGTEYPHTLAACRMFRKRSNILIGIQGLCSVYANAYFANLPAKVITSVTFRDIIKMDTIIQAQKKFARRGRNEIEAIRLAGNLTGRTGWDRHYAKQFNLNARYYHVNEILRSTFYDGEWSEESADKHTIFLSQGDYPIKGLHYMLTAMRSLKEKYPDIRLRVAGNRITDYASLKDRIKISAYGSYIRRLISDYGLSDRVEFLGSMDAEGMKREYLNAGIFVCPSSIENSPNSLGEAMLLGVPCVTADVGGISSIFNAGTDGIMYEGFRQNDAERTLESISGKLALSVDAMWSDPERMEEYRQNAMRHARKTHNREENYRKLKDIYGFIAENTR